LLVILTTALSLWKDLIMAGLGIINVKAKLPDKSFISFKTGNQLSNVPK